MIELPPETRVSETRSTQHDGNSDKDAALAIVDDYAKDIDPRVEKRVLRKIDLFFMPAMLIGGRERINTLGVPSALTLPDRIWNCLLGQSNSWKCLSIWNDQGPVSLGGGLYHNSSGN